jgi:hypothetical protein
LWIDDWQSQETDYQERCELESFFKEQQIRKDSLKWALK